MAGYETISPNELYAGKTYADCLKGFWKWLYSVDCDHNNSGDVVYLRGVAKPESGEKEYVGGPVVRAGDDALTISSDQAVFFCNITTNTEAFGERADDQEPQLRGACLADLRQSKIPRDGQIRIDGENIKLSKDTDYSDYRIVTDEYTLHVPDEEYGSTLAQYIDVVLPPDDYRCVASGYCFCIKFEPGSHQVYSWGQGKPWKRGTYYSEILYEIEVLKQEGEPMSVARAQKPPFVSRISRMLTKMRDDKEIDQARFNKLKTCIEGK